MKKIMILLFLVFSFNLNLSSVLAISCDECSQYSEGTTAHLNCINNCTEENESNSNTYSKIQCGDTKIPYIFAQITSTVILIIQILVPVIIILFGMLDLGKAVMAQKEDEIKKGWQTFIKRLLIGVLVFLVIVIVKFIIGLVAENYEINCIDCFVNNDQCIVN